MRRSGCEGLGDGTNPDSSDGFLASGLRLRTSVSVSSLGPFEARGALFRAGGTALRGLDFTRWAESSPVGVGRSPSKAREAALPRPGRSVGGRARRPATALRARSGTTPAGDHSVIPSRHTGVDGGSEPSSRAARSSAVVIERSRPSGSVQRHASPSLTGSSLESATRSLECSHLAHSDFSASSCGASRFFARATRTASRRRRES